MKHASIVLGTLFLAAVGLHEASAGARIAMPVSVGSNYADGYVGTARNSADSVQHIGCEVVAWSSDRYVECVAVNAAGTPGTCYSRALPMVENAIGIGDSDYIQFGWNKLGECTYVLVSRGSTGEPKR
jgi:hypothetical protein